MDADNQPHSFIKVKKIRAAGPRLIRDTHQGRRQREATGDEQLNRRLRQAIIYIKKRISQFPFFVFTVPVRV